MNKRSPLIHRRTQHVGVLSDGIWSAHDRGRGDNGVPCTNLISLYPTHP